MVADMRPTDVLRAEHEHILKACSVLHAMAAHLEKGGAIAIDEASIIVDFIRFYADGLHHVKEERVLFPAMIEAGLPHRGGPITVMLNEHELGRRHVGGMVNALQALQTSAGRASFALAARNFADLLEPHIAKENNVLFMMAEQLLENDAPLLKAYAEREAEARQECGDKPTHEAALAALSTRWL